jgi:hypothetical protein
VALGVRGLSLVVSRVLIAAEAISAERNSRESTPGVAQGFGAPDPIGKDDLDLG